MITRKQVQNEFEASCFMHEVNEAWTLRESINKFNNNESMNKEQRILLAKMIVKSVGVYNEDKIY